MRRILEVKSLKKTFNKKTIPVMAVNDISFHIKEGECLGLVGESGCGKSTAAKIITRLLEPDTGSVLLNGEEILHLKGKKQREIYSDIQMVFQSPQDSFDPRCTLGDGIMESMFNQGMRKNQAKARLLELLAMVELGDEFADRYPHEVSGGQCQRAAIARALAPEPKLVIFDESTSALDVTVQAQIVKLLKKLQKEKRLSMLVITHDLALVQRLCDRVLVMYKGSIIEQGSSDDIIQRPAEAYTRALIDSVF